MDDQTTPAVELAGRLEHEGEVLPAIGAASSGRLCIEAAALLRTQAEALGQIGRMRIFPDDQINRTTLGSAIHIARAALSPGGRETGGEV